jgi:hypothetical protein
MWEGMQQPVFPSCIYSLLRSQRRTFKSAYLEAEKEVARGSRPSQRGKALSTRIFLLANDLASFLGYLAAEELDCRIVALSGFRLLLYRAISCFD